MRTIDIQPEQSLADVARLADLSVEELRKISGLDATSDTKPVGTAMRLVFVDAFDKGGATTKEGPSGAIGGKSSFASAGPLLRARAEKSLAATASKPPTRVAPASVLPNDTAGPDTRLGRQLEFLLRIDSLKTVYRHNIVGDHSRRENAAEHAWHLGAMVGLLFEYAPPGTDRGRAAEMALIHDIIEVEAGDAPAYDKKAVKGQGARELKAADHIFAMLPQDQAAQTRSLWDEFEAGKTPTAKFVRALDRLQPVLMHTITNGDAWKEQQVKKSQLLKRVAEIEHNVPSLWPLVSDLVNTGVARGQLVDG
ncbi:MAG: HD domain-containing protein [Deltaproteobacteria bacterium]|nr:HD domain-containing protein [Deltaproteobacteria bacterium]